MPIWCSCSYATLLRKCHEELPVLHVILSMRLERLSGTEGVLGAYPHTAGSLAAFIDMFQARMV